jgi:Contractile injection system tube protein
MGDNSKVLSKLIIHSFEKNDFREESLSFTTPINPETFTKTSHVELDMTRGHGQPGTDPKYKSTAPEELKIEFILDGTKTMEGYVKKYKDMEVTDQLKEFTDCVYQYKGNIHRPRFLIVRWGSEIKFPCVLSHMDINYSLFKPNGDPLRAKVTASFVKYDTPEAIFRANNINSPDLTHIKIFTQGSRLDLMTYKIYNDVNFFLQVARSNNLSNVRHIKTGTDLYFPPINKNEA